MMNYLLLQYKTIFHNHAYRIFKAKRRGETKNLLLLLIIKAIEKFKLKLTLKSTVKNRFHFNTYIYF